MIPEYIQPEINANWARTQAKEVMSEQAKRQLESILLKIKEAVLKNKMYAYENSIDDIVKKELERRGFSVEFNNVSTNDPRETSYYTIKW